MSSDQTAWARHGSSEKPFLEADLRSSVVPMDEESKQTLRAMWQQASLTRDQPMMDAIRREFGKDWALRAKVDPDTPRLHEVPVLVEFDSRGVPEREAEAVGMRVAEACGVVLAQYNWSTVEVRYTFSSLGQPLDTLRLMKRVVEEFRIRNASVSTSIPRDPEDEEPVQDAGGFAPPRRDQRDLWDEDQQRELDLLQQGAEREVSWVDQEDPEVIADYFRNRWQEGDPPW